VFRRSLEATAGGPLWTVYEGPPTANGLPGVHHLEARVFKDAFPRYRTMRGWHVPRRAGWDCHGLPVEVAVEKELGLAGKPDIEAYGIAEFNQRCRESVLRHVDAFAAMTAGSGTGPIGRRVQNNGRERYRVGLWSSKHLLRRAFWSATGSARTARCAPCPIAGWASRRCTRRSPTRP
jgi:isoleucyl-tRNA synthetase